MGSGARQQGFTRFELVICVLVLTLVGTALYERYSSLVVDAEKAAYQGVLGWLQAGINVRMSLAVTSGNMDTLETLENSNPMVLVERVMVPPSNYIGELASLQAANARRGSWYFDKDLGALVYRIRYRDTAEGFAVSDDERIYFRLKLRYLAADNGVKPSVSGLYLERTDSP